MNSHLDFFYDELLPEQEDELELFFYKWQKFGVEQLGWKPSVALAIITSGNKLKNTNGEFEVLSKTIVSNVTMSSRTESSSNKCDCNVGLINSCGWYNMECIETSCELAYSCGALWLQDCEGECLPESY